jgi:hypothetical protein
MKDANWKEVLIGLYEHLRAQQETLRHLAVGSAALVAALSEASPKFAKQFERRFEVEMRGPIGQKHTAALEAIDSAISGLRGHRKKVS